MPGLLKPTLALGFRPEHHDELGTGLHQFGIGQHNSAAWKVLKARTDQHQVIVVNGAEPSLDDTAKLTVPDGVFLPDTMTMVRGSHARLRVVLVALFGTDHHTLL